MTQEERQLLIKDLCIRLPYSVMCSVTHKKNGKLVKEDMKLSGIFEDGNFYFLDGMGSTYSDNYIPYLRSMSSMTEEEKEELRIEHIKDEKLFADCIVKATNGDNSMRGKVVPHFAAEWCNKNHFDYRNLIDKGLALEVPKGMYNN